MTALTDAIDRLASYNSGAYDVVDNPYGFDNNGHQQNFVQACNDIATVIGASVQVRIRLSGTQNYYVAPPGSGGSNSNDGLSAEFPWATLQYAWDYIHANVDSAGQSIIVNIADGTYSGVDCVFEGQIPGISPANPITFLGNTSTPANVVINAPALCFKVYNGASIKLQGMTFTSGGGALQSSNGGFIGLNSGLVFGVTAISHLSASYAGMIEIFSGYTISGSAALHAQADQCGIIEGGGFTITLTGSPVFPFGMLLASRCGSLHLYSITLSGSTGVGSKKYDAFKLGMVDTEGGWTVPGSVAGTTSVGGQFA